MWLTVLIWLCHFGFVIGVWFDGFFLSPSLHLSQWWATKWGSVLCLCRSPQLFPGVKTLENNDLMVSTRKSFIYGSGKEIIQNWIISSCVLCSFFLQKIFWFALLINRLLDVPQILLCLTNDFFAIAVERMGCVVFHLRSFSLWKSLFCALASHWTSVASFPPLLSLEGSKQSAHKPTVHALGGFTGLIRKCLGCFCCQEPLQAHHQLHKFFAFTLGLSVFKSKAELSDPQERFKKQ